MISNRTISYIGLWALIMPWLGFSWGTKTMLFSLTGALLLFIGNRHYNNNNKKNNHVKNASSIKNEDNQYSEQIDASLDNPIIEVISANISTMLNESPSTDFKKEDPINFENQKSSQMHDMSISKTRTRRKIESKDSFKKIKIQSENQSYENHVDYTDTQEEETVKRFSEID